jgi:MarR family transcriptional regulator, 2-MHQ and catechol-resistance regulon repressor
MERKCTNLPFMNVMQTSKDIHERIKKEMAMKQLSITEFSVLEALYQNGKQTIQKLANSILFSSGSMTYVIDKLEQRGLLSRNACPDDRRVIHVILTNDGNHLMEDIMPQYHRLVDNMFDSLSHDEREQLVHLLKKVRGKG